MCYVFLQAETFAMRGGPGANGNGQLFGVYSAILVQNSLLYDLTQSGQPVQPPQIGNGLGLLTISAPASGPAVGNILLFDSQTGNTFLGKANGLTNPQTGQLICMVSGSEYSLQSTTTTTGNSTGTVTPSTGAETLAGRLTLAKSLVKNITYSEISGTASLIVANIFIITGTTTTGSPPVTTNTGNTIVGTPATYDVVGYLTSTSTATPPAFVLSESN